MVYQIKRRVVLGGIAASLLPARSGARRLDTVDLQHMIDSNAGHEVRLPEGTFEIDRLLIPSNTKISGAGIGRTVLRGAAGLSQPIIANKDLGSANIQLSGMTIDGNDLRQNMLVNGLQFINPERCRFDIEVRNCAGSGIVISGGSGNCFTSGMFVHANGRRRAGYGLYLFGSSNNRIDGGRYDDNCIGIAVEASGKGCVSKENSVVAVRCNANRADFGQSGAGVHFEQTEGGDCNGGIIKDVICSNSTGVGINNTGCNLRIDGGMISRNQQSAITTIAAIGIWYSKVICRSNAPGVSNGYRAEMRFDDTSLIPGTTGLVEHCDLFGDAPDGGIRCMSMHSALIFKGNRVKGYKNDYIVSGTRDSISGSAG